MNSTETFIEGDGIGIDVDWTGGRRLTVDLNPIRL